MSVLKLGLVDHCEIELFTHTTCQMCSAEIHLPLVIEVTMRQQLASKGWHCVELTDEVFSAVCPQCIESLKQQLEAEEL